MWNIESIVPCAAFVEARYSLEVLALSRIERFEETAFGCDRSQGSGFCAVVVPVAEGPLSVEGCVFCLAQIGCEQRECIIGDIVFEGM